MDEETAEASTFSDLLRALAKDGVPPELASQALERISRGQSIGRYLVLDRLGEGGMGLVLAAYDPELDRKVALKLLRPGLVGAGGEERLHREAQAIARVSHPNVVAVYDVGSFEGTLFIAMELVEGTNLREWLAEAPRSWREVVAVFLAAGRGLAAAHGAGLVHRDFKPENVLIGADGRVRVADFGVARAAYATDPGVPEKPPSPSANLTVTGARIGTPAYMSPEQLRGERADARSDQYSFCVALGEALYGERPSPELPPSRPGHARAPHRLSRLLLRGLSRDPAGRFPSMDALLGALERVPGNAARRWIAVGLVAAALGVALLVQQVMADRAALCAGAERQLDGVWDRLTQRAVERAFLKSTRPYAAESLATVTRVLDAYGRDWAAMRQGACEATHRRGEQSEGLLSLRLRCLDQRRQELGALAQALTHADDAVVTKSVQAVHGLKPLSMCADAEALTALLPLPGDPAQRARMQELGAIFADVRALRHTGQYRDGHARAEAALPAIRAVAYAPLEAEAWLEVSQLRDLTAAKDTEAALHEALVAAETGRHEEMRVRAMTGLVFELGHRHARREEAFRWGRHARASLGRLREPELAKAQLLHNIAIVHNAAGNHDAAIAEYQECLALRSAALGPEHPHIASTRNNLGNTLQNLGRYAEAAENYRRAIAIYERTLGASHPYVGMAANNLGNTLNLLGDGPAALASYARAKGILRQALGDDHPGIGTLLANESTVRRQLGELDEALRLSTQALALQERKLGPRHPGLTTALQAHAQALAAVGRAAEALPVAERELAITEKAHGANHPDVAGALESVSAVQRALGRWEAAAHALRRALGVEERTLPRDHPGVADTVAALANVERRLGRPLEALQMFARARAIWELRFGAEHAHLTRALVGMGLCAAALGRKEEAATHLARALAIAEKRFGSDDARRWAAALHLANAERALGRHAEAAARYARVLEWLGAVPAAQRRWAATSTAEALERAAAPEPPFPDAKLLAALGAARSRLGK